MYLIRLLIKNAFRHKLRTALTILGITVAILAFGLLRTMIGAWYAGVDAASASRLVTRNSISLVFPMPVAYKEKIRQIDGVEMVSWGNWFGGVYIEEKNFFANFAVDPKTYLALYPEFMLPADQLSAVLRDRKAAVVGRKLAEKYGWKLGDPITLKGTIFPGNWDFVLKGIYTGRDKGTDETQFFFHWEYLNESLKKTAPQRADSVGFYMIGITNPSLAAPVSIAIDRSFQNSLAETLTETEKAFNLSFVAMTDAIVIAVQAVSFIVIFIILAVTANTMAMTARERIGEYAVFKTLGFRAYHIAGLVFGESLVIATIGTTLGILLTFPAAAAFGKAMNQFLPVFNVELETIGLDCIAGVFVGLVAAIAPTWRAATIRIADGLRRIG